MISVATMEMRILDRLDVEDLRQLCKELQAQVCAHHSIANLSDEVLREWGASKSNYCPVCERAREQLAA